MKRNLSKTLCLILTLSFAFHMFTPLTVLAYGAKQVTIAWNCDGGICANAHNVLTYEENTPGNRVYADNMILANSLIDGGHAFSAASASSYGKTNQKVQFYVFEGTVIDEIKTKGTWNALVAAIDDCLSPNPTSCDASTPLPINPAGAKDGPKSVGHNGDQEFRLIIYDNGFTAVQFDVNPDNYTYYLGEWDPFFANPINELSDDIDNPTIYNTYLLENKLSFNAFEDITSVKAIDVSNKGVSIQVLDRRKCNITFNSNYYSEVVFEVTFASGKKGYFKANRQFVRFADNSELVMEHLTDKREAYAEFIYPEDKSYEDYDVYATYTIGSKTETKKLTAVKTKVKNPHAGPGEDQFTEGMSVGAGTRLKSTRYKIDVTKDTKDVSITVTKKGATEGNNYGGTFGGNGKGVKLDIARFVQMLNDAGGRQ